jgi:hypothetical protein
MAGKKIKLKSAKPTSEYYWQGQRDTAAARGAPKKTLLN